MQLEVLGSKVVENVENPPHFFEELKIVEKSRLFTILFCSHCGRHMYM